MPIFDYGIDYLLFEIPHLQVHVKDVSLNRNLEEGIDRLEPV